MNFQSPETISKTTLNLAPGDVVSRGNAWDGFWSYTVLAVAKSAHNPRMAIVTVQFDHGGTCDLVEGKNARWSVLAPAQAHA
jgi:hypothetical protein